MTIEHFEGHQPRECGEHRTLGSHRAWCYNCSEYCYPRIQAACNGCRNPVIEKLLDDMGAFLDKYFHDDTFVLQEGIPLPEVSELLERYRAFKGLDG